MARTATPRRVKGPDGSFVVRGKAANGEGSLYQEADGVWRATYWVPGETRPRRVRGRTREEAFRRRLEAVERAATSRSQSPAHAALKATSTVSHLALWWLEARNLGVVASNAVDRVRPPTVRRRSRRALTAAEARALVSAAVDDRLGAAVALLVRPRLLGLAWADVDLDAGLATVRRACVYADGHGMMLGPPKTAGAEGQHLLAPIVVELLRRRKEDQAAEIAAAGAAWWTTAQNGANPGSSILIGPGDERRAAARSCQPSKSAYASGSVKILRPPDSVLKDSSDPDVLTAKCAPGALDIYVFPRPRVH